MFYGHMDGKDKKWDEGHWLVESVLLTFIYIYIYIPSGKHTENYGKSQFLMGKSTISMAIFQFAM